MQRFKARCLSLLLCAVVAASYCGEADGKESVSKSEKRDYPSVTIRKNEDGLIVVINNNLNKLENVNFGCDQGKNEIFIDLPTENEHSIAEKLKRNPNIVQQGVSVSTLPTQGMKQIRIIPKEKLYCQGANTVSRFHSYVTYLYPTGRDLNLEEVVVTGFQFDETVPQSHVHGTIRLLFNEPLGNADLSDTVSTANRTLAIRLNPKDFSNQQKLSTILPIEGVTADGTVSEKPGQYLIGFERIHDVKVGGVQARVVRLPKSSEVRIDVTVALSLYEKGKEYYERGDLPRAILYMEAAKKEQSFELISRMSLGTIYWNEDRYTDAVAAFRELIALDKSWKYPDARYYASKAHYLAFRKLPFDLAAVLKEYLRRCERNRFNMCSEAEELSAQVNEPRLKINSASRPEVKKLLARLADPKLNYSEVQRNVFHYWAIWCPVCLEEMPKIMQYAVDHPNVSIYIIAKHDNPKTILDTLLKSGAIKRDNIFYYIDTKDDIMLELMVPAILANKEPLTPLPISVFLQRDVPFYLTDKLDWTDAELSRIWGLRYR